MQWVQSQHVWNPVLIRVVTYRRPHYQVIPPADVFYCRSQVWLNPQLCSTLRRNPHLSIIQNRTRTFWHDISADEQHVDLSKRSYQAYRGTCTSCRPSDDEPLMSRESDCSVFRRGRSQGPPYAHFSWSIQIHLNHIVNIIFIPSQSNLLQYFHTSSDPSAQVTLISNSALGSNGWQNSLREIFGVSTVKS